MLYTRSEMNNTLITILGPTATGKTDFAIRLAQKLNTEIISSDSRQMYREMKIGTARPGQIELNSVTHHFIGNLSIHDYYNASMFEEEVLSLLGDLFQKHASVIMVGGSGMYIDAVCKGIDELPVVDAQIRMKLQEQYKNEGIESLRIQLKLIDPDYYTTVDLKNPNRILKGLEISIMTGKPYSSFLTRKRKHREFRILKIGLNLPRELLYQRINHRVDQMLEAGLIEEARKLFPLRSLNALNTVGYKELFSYFDGSIDREKAIELIKRNTRHFAKRQITWFKRDPEINWIHPNEFEKAVKTCQRPTRGRS